MSKHVFKGGDQIKVIEGEGKGRTLHLSHDINSPGYVERDEYWAEAYASLEDALNGYGDRVFYIDHEDHVELVKSIDELPKPALPTVADLRWFMGGALLAQQDGLEVNQTEVDGELLLIYGTTATGKRFSAHVEIKGIEDGA